MDFTFEDAQFSIEQMDLAYKSWVHENHNQIEELITSIEKTKWKLEELKRDYKLE
jgi:hypothetical protein